MPIMDRLEEEEWPLLSKSSTAQHTSNPIRNIVDRLKVQPNPEKCFLTLGLGDPAVYENLRAPDEAIQAVQEALLSGKHNGYPPAVGTETARAAIAQRYSCKEAPLEAKDVIITSGCSGALEIALSVLASTGKNVLLPQPGFSLYRTLCDNKGISVKYYRLLPERNWEIDLEQVHSLIDSDTVAWLINNPSNPCGSVYELEHLQACKELAAKHCLTIIADEIYEDLVFAPYKFHPLASLKPSIPMLSVGGLAKRFLVPGWRMGWILVHDTTSSNALQQIRSGLIDLAGIILGSNSLIQAALPAIFTNVPSSFHQKVNNYVAENARIAFDCLQGTPGLLPIQPQGAFYMMVGLDCARFGFENDVQLCERLISEESVLCLPGVIFGMPNYMRIVYCAPPQAIREACERIRSFSLRHYAK